MEVAGFLVDSLSLVRSEGEGRQVGSRVWAQKAGGLELFLTEIEKCAVV